MCTYFDVDENKTKIPGDYTTWSLVPLPRGLQSTNHRELEKLEVVQQETI